MVTKPKFVSIARKLKDSIRRRVMGQAKSVTLEGSPEVDLPPLFDEHTWEFIDIPVVEVARQLAIIEHGMYKKIQPKECLNKRWEKADKSSQAPNLLAVIHQFNRVFNLKDNRQMSSWVVKMIVKEENERVRCALIARFVDIAQASMVLNNYNSAMEILSAFNSSPIFRLNKTWEVLQVKISITHRRCRRVR